MFDMKRLRPLLVLTIVLGAGYAAYAYLNRPPTSLVLTGIVTTNDVIVSPQIAGQIGRLMVKEGDQVKKDQLVAVITPDELKADTAYFAQNVEGLSSQVQAATADLENARLTFTRTQNLSQQHVVSSQELDQARTALTTAQAKLDALNRQVEAQRAAVALAHSNAEQVAVRRSQVKATEHMQAAAAAQRTK